MSLRIPKQLKRLFHPHISLPMMQTITPYYFRYHPQSTHYTPNKIVAEIGEIIGQRWSELVDICPDMFLVKTLKLSDEVFD